MQGDSPRKQGEIAAPLAVSTIGMVGTWIRRVRHPLRLLAMALAALALTWGMSSGWGMVSAVAGASAGVVLGELVGRSRLRGWAVALVMVALLVAGLWLSEVVTSTRAVALWIGPARTIEYSVGLRHFIAFSIVVAGIRVLANRRPAFLGLELVAVIGAFAAMFASHRQGVVARPLWLSDWAWQQGYDPTTIFLVIGAGAVVLVASIMLAESEQRLTVVTVLSLPCLAVLAVMFLGVQGLPDPKPVNQLGLTENELGDPPQNRDEDEGRDRQSGEGDQPQQAAGGAGGQGQPQQGQGQQSPGEQGAGQQPDAQGQRPGDQGQSNPGNGQGQQQGQAGQQPQRQSDVENQDPNAGNAPAPMAVVLLGDDYSPSTEAFYFRQDVWSHFNGSRLVASRHGEVDLDIVRRFPARSIEVKEQPPVEGHVRIHQTVALLVEHAAPFGLESPVTMAPEPNPDSSKFIRAYQVESLAPDYDFSELVGREIGNPEWSDAARGAYLAGPDDPRYRELAESIITRLPEAKSSDPFLRALSIKLWMDEHLTYSTAERHAGVPDPAADFLFGNRIGYCVHFAHAAVYMWRSLGIPARVGTGYHVEEENRRGSTLLIRGGDAHAWPELYLDGIGWVILDISAQTNLDPPGTPVDSDLAELLGEMARRDPDPGSADSLSRPEPEPFGRELALAALWLALTAFAGLHGAKAYRRLAPRWCSNVSAPRVCYRTILDRLAEVGHQRRYGETREAFARRMSEHVPCLGALTRLHVSARFADPGTSGGDGESRTLAWRRGVATAREEISRSAPRWRRVLGALDPISFLRVR